MLLLKVSIMAKPRRVTGARGLNFGSFVLCHLSTQITMTAMKGETKMADKKIGRGRSAITGKYVKHSYVKAHPKTTVTESTRRRKR